MLQLCELGECLLNGFLLGVCSVVVGDSERHGGCKKGTKELLDEIKRRTAEEGLLFAMLVC